MLQQQLMVAPDDDVMYYFKRVYSMPLFPGRQRLRRFLQLSASTCHVLP
jgi:hypothetical protein